MLESSLRFLRLAVALRKCFIFTSLILSLFLSLFLVLSPLLRLAQVPYPVERIVEQPVIKEVEVIKEVPVVIEKTVEKVVTKEVCR